MSLICAEYVCPEHGKFDCLVERDESGSAPEMVWCVEDECPELASWTPSAPLGRVKPGEVSQGKVRKAEVPTWTDTEPLANGMSLKEWKKRRAEVWKDHRYKQNLKDGRKGMA